MNNSLSLSLVSNLETLLIAAGYSSGCKVWSSFKSLRSSLSSPLIGSALDYTTTRAVSLRDLSLKIRSLLLTAKDVSTSYADRALILSSVADNYLKLTHAFKVDADVWSKAQLDLVPMLSSISDEKSLDLAVLELETHLDTYLKALDAWVSR